MLELKITAQLLSSAENDIIGIKEAIIYLVEQWSDVVKVEVKTSEPLQLTLGNKPEIRQTVTVAAAMQAIKAHNLTLEEMQNVVAALVELTKLEGA